MEHYAVLGDDLTGCMDAGAKLADKGYEVSVLLGFEGLRPPAKRCDVVIADTESRNLPPGEAYAAVGGWLAEIRNAGRMLLYKKIDSTLRGNLGAELAALLDAGWDAAVLAPALPGSGRATIGGIHFVNGLKLADSDLANDPFSPVGSSYIPDIIAKQAGIVTAVIPAGEIGSGAAALRLAMERARASGCRLLVMDAQTEDHLRLAAAAARLCGPGALACGSAGLLAHMLPRREEGARARARGPAVPGHKPVVAISGSPARQTASQIAYARSMGVSFLPLDTESFSAVSVTRLADEAARTLDAGKNALIAAVGGTKEELRERYGGRMVALKEKSRMIQEALLRIAQTASHGRELGGMLLVGGDTAYRVLTGVGAAAVRLEGEIEPMVPFGRIEGGELHGAAVAAKAGGLGSNEAILNAIRFLRSGNNE